jgi:hypothetical protein
MFHYEVVSISGKSIVSTGKKMGLTQQDIASHGGA